MDNLCHTLCGAALGKAGLASRTRFGMATLMVAANIPDIDVAVFLTDTLPMSFRRGWTHGVLAQVALPLALAGVVWVIGRRLAHPADGGRQAADVKRHTSAGSRQPAAVSFRQLLLLSFIGLYSHIFLDLLNSYGLRLLMPFSNRWFYGDALYIVDPWLYMLFGGGVWLASRAARRGLPRPGRAAMVSLALAAIYAIGMLGSNLWARSVVAEGLTRAGQPEMRFMVTPVFANPFRREVLIDTGDRYEKGALWFEPAPHFRPLGYGVDKGFDQPEAQVALVSPRAQAYLRWSRFPFVVVDRTTAPPRLLLNDYRYSDQSARVGWAGLGVQIGE
jgi:inner membrane protein